MPTSTRPSWLFSPARLSETAVLMAAAWLTPFLIHLIPWSGTRPLGVYLLPAFWTTFVAVYLFGFGLGALVALVTPIVALLATGLPALGRVGLMAGELIGFVVVAAWLLKRWPNLGLIAPLSYLSAKAGSVLVEWLAPYFHDGRNPVDHYLASVHDVWAGLVVLLLINLLLPRFVPRRASQPDPGQQDSVGE